MSGQTFPFTASGPKARNFALALSANFAETFPEKPFRIEDILLDLAAPAKDELRVQDSA